MKATAAVLFAGVVLAVSGCGSTTTTSAGTTTTAKPAVSAPASPGATQVTQATQPVDQTVQPGQPAQPGQTTDQAPVVVPAPATDQPAQTTPPVATTIAAPVGSGHGLCFDLNSGLANSAVKRLAAKDAGPWQIQGASDDAIADGCDGVLSYLIVTSGNIHPWTHVLYFTNGTYLGTATSQPYGYTEVIGKTRNTVQIQYRWLKSNEPLCCPAGGPSTVTFTLTGTTVQANGQFPPS